MRKQSLLFNIFVGAVVGFAAVGLMAALLLSPLTESQAESDFKVKYVIHTKSGDNIQAEVLEFVAPPGRIAMLQGGGETDVSLGWMLHNTNWLRIKLSTTPPAFMYIPISNVYFIISGIGDKTKSSDNSVTKPFNLTMK